MKAAKHAPEPRLAGEAQVAADIVQAWANGGDDATISVLVHHDQTCEWQRNGFVAGVADRTCTCGAVSDAELVSRTVDAAVAEYLRQNPRARSPEGVPYQWYPNGERNAKGRAEFDVICLFCRASLNTLVRSGSPPPAFWKPVYKHTWTCAALFLGGLLKGTHPSTKHGVLPVSKLKSKALLRHAKEAAEYLEVAQPRGGKYGTRTPADTMRAMIVDARRVRKALAEEDLALAKQLLDNARATWGTKGDKS